MNIPSWARVGAKVVCVDDGDFGQGSILSPIPPAGSVCTIQNIIPDVWGDGFAFVISGFPNLCPRKRFDVGWKARRFRPLVTRTQEEDVALFTHLLDDIPVNANDMEMEA